MEKTIADRPDNKVMIEIFAIFSRGYLRLVAEKRQIGRIESEGCTQ